jgi:hypothetical protein
MLVTFVFTLSFTLSKISTRNEYGQYQNIWEKTKLTDDNGEEVVFTPNGQRYYEVFKQRDERKARIEILWRPHKTGYIVTITLLNTQQIAKEIQDDPKRFIEDQNKKALFNMAINKPQVSMKPIYFMLSFRDC